MPYKDPEKRRAANRRYNNKPERKAYLKEYRREYQKRPEVKLRLKEYHKKYQKRPEYKLKKKEYYKRPEVKKKKKEYHREYYKRPERKKRKYELRKNNPAHQKRKQLRHKVRFSVIHQRCFTSTIHKLIGCDVPTARAHLEAQFEPWMTWENYGCEKGKWTIDHIKRISSIDIFDEDEVKRIFHYTNMRPLCFIKNCEDHDEGRGLL